MLMEMRLAASSGQAPAREGTEAAGAGQHRAARLDAGLDCPMDAGLDSLPLGLVRADADDRITAVNRAFFRLTECTPADLGLMGFRDVLSLFCLGLCADEDDIRYPEDEWLPVEKYLRTAEGGEAWVRIRFLHRAGADIVVDRDSAQNTRCVTALPEGVRLAAPAALLQTGGATAQIVIQS